MSVPAIDTRNGINGIDYVFNQFHGNDLFRGGDPILTEIESKTNYEHYRHFNMSQPPDPHSVYSQNGYKLKLENTGIDTWFEYNGFIIQSISGVNQGLLWDNNNSYTTSHYIKAANAEDPLCEIVNPEAPEENQIVCREIYIGYNKWESMEPDVALAPIWDDIIEIKADGWGMNRVREPVQYGYTPVWLGWALAPILVPKIYRCVLAVTG